VRRREPHWEDAWHRRESELTGRLDVHRLLDWWIDEGAA
jgi:hypothetical protein